MANEAELEKMTLELIEAQKIEKSLRRNLYFYLPVYGTIVGWHTDSTRARIKVAAKTLKTLEDVEGFTPHIKDIRAWVNYYQHKSDDASVAISQANYRW